jgi:hypothetical protein
MDINLTTAAYATIDDIDGRIEILERALPVIAATCDQRQINKAHGFVEQLNSWRDLIKALIEEISKLPQRPIGGKDLKAVRRVRHKKSGTYYDVISSDVVLQSSNSDVVKEDTNLVVYRDDDGRMWCRPAKEFYDGRFKAVNDETSHETPSPIDKEESSDEEPARGRRRKPGEYYFTKMEDQSPPVSVCQFCGKETT